MDVSKWNEMTLSFIIKSYFKKKSLKKMSLDILLLHSSLRWILSCSWQTSLKRELVASVGMMSSCITSCDRHPCYIKFLITHFYGS
jgi:hypothetical protein